MSSTEEDVTFIKRDLLPEMVYDRLFCDVKSREFVEYDSAIVEATNLSGTSDISCKIYRVNTIVRFSGEPRTFPLIIKLFPSNDPSVATKAFEAFQNEEMFYNKMILKYGKDHKAKCYLADLGKYGRPVLVLEDLVAGGYARINGHLDEDHLRLCVQVLGKFHGRGLRLRAKEFDVFREFYAKLLEITFVEDSARYYEQRSSRIRDVLKSLSDSRASSKIRRKLGDSPLENAKNAATKINDVSTICHGHFSQDNLLFKCENEKPIDVKVIDWQTMRYCSPAIDLAAVFFSNATVGNGDFTVKLEDILSVYIDAVKREYPEITVERLREDMVDKLPVACLILSLKENVTDEMLQRAVSRLERFGIFD